MPATIPLARPLARASFAAWSGIVAGALLPLLAALLYRTYGYDLQPEWLNTTRQLGFIWLAAELAIVLWQRHHGYDPAALIRSLPRWTRRALILFLITFWISSCTTKVPSFSLGLAIGYVIHLLFAGALYHRLRRGFAPDVTASAAGFALGLALLVPIIALHLATMPAGLVPATLSGAIPGFVSHRLFGAWAGAVAALLLGLAWQQRRGDPTVTWLYPALTLALALVAWTGTRAALIGLAAAVLAGLLLAGWPRRGVWPRLALCLLVAVVVGTLLAPADPSFSFLRPHAPATPNGVSSGRFDYWRDALVVAAQHPWLGNGMGSSLWIVADGPVFHVQPHNVLVQFLLFWGLIPTVAALWLLGQATWRAHAAARVLPALVPMVMMLDCLLAMSLLDGMFHFARFVMLIVALLAICLAAGACADRTA